MPIVEIVKFPGSDAFVADQLVFKSALDILLNAAGVISVYYGKQVEDGTTGYLVVVWETYEDHTRSKEHAKYPDLLESLRLAASGPLDVQHVPFDIDSSAVFGAPATEIAIITPKADASKDVFSSTFRTLREELIKEKSCHSVIWGESRERSPSIVLAIGWDSVQAHADAVAGGVFPDIIGSLSALADINLTHTSFVKYSK
ncbi:hypothetical protein Hypma_000708 [Hypsizygus marmoreus]|uniref:ABM domain-containing protein n=1 Tax=Hypsizygus marmoreus TaxID=39966 RepID=A0A369J9L7_HYPMA|nr:hypothetical protein Hypma_000708 [Hypsizygus marmoreus]